MSCSLLSREQLRLNFHATIGAHGAVEVVVAVDPRHVDRIADSGDLGEDTGHGVGDVVVAAGRMVNRVAARAGSAPFERDQLTEQAGST